MHVPGVNTPGTCIVNTPGTCIENTPGYACEPGGSLCM